ncbi:phospholipase C [Longilinea arvoryzae]|uniref:Phospholipase C n=1 Tax=Longilinea arvoryzae TaxID=360412 RepID=A0A0S7B7N4_9CHLR|nr:alkaline phosphatase family protein [Longilinea arvoryzae]GAP13118.1 phospholipase C [Longilinea arvoryzae]
MKRILPILGLLILLLAACLPTSAPVQSPAAAPSLTSTATVLTPSTTPSPTALSSETPAPTPAPPVPNFSHIVILIFENREFDFVIGNRDMPNYNVYAEKYTLLTQYYAVTHPSLPNYLALIGGDTFGIRSDCEDCFIDAPSLPDRIEASGRTWKTYQESMPEPCAARDTLRYMKKHNPFVYFDAVRLDAERCRRSVVPLDQLDADLQANALPDFAFITPNLCHSGHDCDLDEADAFAGEWLGKLLAYPGMLEDGLIVLTWDEGQGEHTCCGLETGGGRVASVLISNRVTPGLQDDTPYTHYSLLKTISAAWGLPELGHAVEASLIEKPWR